MSRAAKFAGAAFLLPLVVVSLYLAAAFVGAHVKRAPAALAAAGSSQEIDIYITATALHADIVLPNIGAVRSRFSHLSETGLAIHDPRARYISLGWGSRAFYPVARDLTTITLSATLQAVMGDRSVIHAQMLSHIIERHHTRRISLSGDQFNRLLDFIDATFSRNKEEEVQLLHGVSFGFGDRFFEAEETFHIFRPCNIWVSDALAKSGLPVGLWTPTTYSLFRSLDHFGVLEPLQPRSTGTLSSAPHSDHEPS
ncbi:MAG: TIGR02117 family protein [Pseudomonadota bacterium]